ncbi:male sterility protein-domain-containing protein [Mycena galericulata]|nr:male sterility protein-domain-containing protein [Mycena galericulata]
MQSVPATSNLTPVITPDIAALNSETNPLGPLYSYLHPETVKYNPMEKQTSITANLFEPPTVWDVDQIQAFLLELSAKLCNVTKISATVDLFQQGFNDSIATAFLLHVIRALRSRRNAALARAADTIEKNLVHSYLTISQLSAYLAGLTAEENLITKYTTTSGLAPRRDVPDSGQPAVVLLTGSAGNLGSQILASLLKDNRVVKIYAFDRPLSRSLADRHLDMFKQRALDTLLLSSPKIVWVEGQIQDKHLGLNPVLYGEMRDSVTLIIHNAWRLNFNMKVTAFEPYILGTRHLIDLALSSPRTPRFLFTSSIATVDSWDSSRGPFPELMMADAHLAMGGYGQGKYVAERILAQSGLNVICFRLGQIYGSPPTGAWATSNWVPILVKTSIILGCLPLGDGLVSWIDFETVAQAIMDVAFAPLQKSHCLPTVLNVVHPRPVPWDFVMNCVRNVLLKEKHGFKNLRLVGFPEWFKELEACSASGRYDKETLPGLKLLEFFRQMSSSSVGSPNAEFGGWTNLAVSKIQELSPAVHDVSSINEETVEAWMNYWRASGLYSAKL